MARIERAEPRVQAPVKQAVLADPNAFRFSGAGEGLEAIGGVLTELGERKKKATDSLSMTETNNSQTLAQAEIKQFMVDNPNPDDWDEGISGILQKQGSAVSQLKSSAETKARIEQSQKAFREQTILNSRILQTEATITEDVKVTGAWLITKIGEGNKDDIKEARDAHEAALLRKESPEIAALSLMETLKEGKKGFYENQSKLFPDKTIKEMEAKKKALGKKDVDDDGLDAKDYDDITASAYTAKAIAQKSKNTQVESDKNVLGEALHDGTINYTMINNTSLDEDDQEQYRVKMNTEANRKATGVPIETNQSVKGDLEDKAYQIWMGSVTKTEFTEQLESARYGTVINGKAVYSFGEIESNNPLIDNSAYDELRTTATKELKTAQAKGLSESQSYGKEQLVEVASELDVASILRDMNLEQRKDFISNRQIQLENWRQYNNSMKIWQSEKQNQDAVEADYYIESRRKLPFYRGRAESDIKARVSPEKRKTEEKGVVDLSKLSDEQLLKGILK